MLDGVLCALFCSLLLLHLALCSPPTSPSSIRLLFLETRGGRCHLSLSKHLGENLCQRFFFFGRASFVFKQVYCAYINIFHFFFPLVVSLGPLETERHTTPSCTSSSYSPTRLLFLSLRQVPELVLLNGTIGFFFRTHFSIL